MYIDFFVFIFFYKRDSNDKMANRFFFLDIKLFLFIDFKDRRGELLFKLKWISLFSSKRAPQRWTLPNELTIGYDFQSHTVGPWKNILFAVSSSLSIQWILNLIRVVTRLNFLMFCMKLIDKTKNLWTLFVHLSLVLLFDVSVG